MAFNSVPDDNLVLWNGRKLRELNERLQKLESKLGINSKPSSSAKSNSFVTVLNDSGEDWSRGRVVGIGDSLVKPGDVDGDLAYQRQNVFQHVATDETSRKFGIASSSAPNGRLAKVIVSGFANAIVDVRKTDHEYAKTTSIDGVLESTSDPTSIRILFANAVGETELCKVILGGQYESSLFPIELEHTGGSDGSSTEQASWSYNIRALGSTSIIKANENPGLNPHHYKRPNLGKMTKATRGIAFLDGAELIVVSTNEVSVFSTC